ncbi:MAG: hypothetical protein AAF203_06325, partial [Pseudomonadota bacterium]
MRNILVTTLLVFVAVTLLGCAKNRDVERVRAGDRQNVLAKSAFLGEDANARSVWMTKMTVVNTSDSPSGTGLFLGFQGDVKIGYFDFNEAGMQFRSLSGQYQGQETENIKNSVLLTWNVDHLDFALDERDGQTTNQEIFDNFRPWHQRKYFRVNWANQLTNEAQMLPSASFAKYRCWNPAQVRRVDDSMKIEPDHIGFKVEVVYAQDPACAGGPQWSEGDFNFTVTYMYSFRKAEPSDYEPKF